MTEKATYRKSNKEDLPQIADLLSRLNLNMDDMREDGFLVASIDWQVLGCARIIEMEDGNVELASVAVVESFRKQGIGSKIIQMILSLEKRRPIYLMCRAANKHFYEKLGFRRIDDQLLPVIYRNKIMAKIKDPRYRNLGGLAMVKE